MKKILFVVLIICVSGLYGYEDLTREELIQVIEQRDKYIELQNDVISKFTFNSVETSQNVLKIHKDVNEIMSGAKVQEYRIQGVIVGILVGIGAYLIVDSLILPSK